MTSMAQKKKTKSKSKKQGKKEQQTFARFLMKWFLVAGIWGGIILFMILAWYGKDLGRIAKAVDSDKQRIVRIYAADEKTELAAYGHLRGPNVRVEDLPEHIPNAFIAIEDRRFYSHFGIDLIGLARAMVTNIRAGGIVQGGSTLTQQLAKNLFFNPERTLKRKIQEAMLSLWIEYKYSKEEILSAYLNHVYFGSGAYGLDSATRIYFGKAPENIGIKEAALLAGLMQAPSRLSPSHNPQGAINRMKIVLNAMVEENYASQAMIDDARNIVITDGKVQGMEFADRNKHSHYFTDWIHRQVNIFASDVEGDLKVVTTLSNNLQKTVAKITKEELDRAYPEDGDKKRPEAAAVILNENGAIRAMVGGYDYNQSQFNRATDGVRQAGSSFKPFVYLAAIEQGWRPDDMISNERITSGRYRPSNYDGFYSEKATLREALLNSYNVASVNLIKETGVKHVVDIADRVGIDAEVREELSTALGTVDVSLIDLVGGYATIGQKGRLVTPYGINKIETKEGELLYQYKHTSSPKVISTNHTDAVTSMMQDVVEFGTGKRAKTGFPIAGKTGTTQDYRDALFVGFSSTYTMGVWMGHDDNSPMGRGAYGGTVPASIFKRSMQTAHRGVPARSITNYDPETSKEFKSIIDGIFSGQRSRFWGSGSSGNQREENKPENRGHGAYDFN
jgi:penicillin-binding protein 1A